MFPTRRHLAAIPGFLISTALACPLLAQASVSEPALRKDYTMEWARRLSLAGVLASLALVGFVLLFRRRQISGAAPQWMLFIGICVMPLPVMLLGSAVALEQAKNVTFCEQCHVMRSFVADMRNPQNEGLAAVHYRNRYIQQSHCYVCHTDYGLFGTLEAKLAGVTHIWRESIGSYTLPVRIAHPYRFMICLDCHARSAKFEGVPQHRGLDVKVARGEAGCTPCHGSSHPLREQRRALR